MLKRINRITKRSEFELLKNEGKFVYGDLWGISFLKTEDENNQFGFVISKKISKKAVDRNRIKRLLTEAIRKKQKYLEGKGWKIVFLAKKNLVGIEFDKVEREMEISLQKIK